MPRLTFAAQSLALFLFALPAKAKHDHIYPILPPGESIDKLHPRKTSPDDEIWNTSPDLEKRVDRLLSHPFWKQTPPAQKYHTPLPTDLKELLLSNTQDTDQVKWDLVKKNDATNLQDICDLFLRYAADKKTNGLMVTKIRCRAL